MNVPHFFRVFHVEDIVADPDAKLRQVLMLSNECDEVVDEKGLLIAHVLRKVMSNIEIDFGVGEDGITSFKVQRRGYGRCQVENILLTAAPLR